MANECPTCHDQEISPILTCGKCGGSGYYIECDKCLGEGVLQVQDQRFIEEAYEVGRLRSELRNITDVWLYCPKCTGSGNIWDKQQP